MIHVTLLHLILLNQFEIYLMDFQDSLLAQDICTLQIYFYHILHLIDVMFGLQYDDISL